MLTLTLNNKPKLPDHVFAFLRDVIYARCGIFFNETKKYLVETRLIKRLEARNLKTFEDYYYFLQYDPAKEQELQQVVNCIVTNETSFFRDTVQLDAFRRGVVPKVIEEKAREAQRTLRVWSAASSTGEEPYTLAMMMVEDGVQAKGFNIEVTGSDIADHVLKSCMAASYEKYSLRNTPESFLRKYFVNNGDMYRVAPKIQELVKFRKINLINSLDTRTVRGMDVIFCRNVLIYFDDASKKKAVGNLYDSLNKGGYLFVGFSETLHNITRLFKPVSFEKSVVYQKV